MKIGILTFHRPSNFGANLQAYSTTRYFQSKGHDVKVIDYVRETDLKYKSSVVEPQYYAHKTFVETNLPLTEQIIDEEGLCRVVKQELFDVILIGADAVWRSPKDNCIYFAKWLFEDENCKCVSVASVSPAHMGKGFRDQPESTRGVIANCLRQFKYITVRDEWTKTVINRDIFDNKVLVENVNPDPVIMLSELIDGIVWDSALQKGKYYLMSLPNGWCDYPRLAAKRKKWFAKFKTLVNQAGYKLVELPIPEGKSGLDFDYIVDYPIDPLQWFLWIKNAKAFCGVRFHAVVSSISNGTPFFSVDSYADKSTLSKLLDVIGLHSIARRKDKASKIRNLLAGSGLEAFRTGPYLEFESPQRVFRQLDAMKREDILSFRDRLREIFNNNMRQIISTVENE